MQRLARHLRDASVLDLVQVAVVALDRRGRVGLINRVGCDLLGYPVEEILGRDWFAHFLPERTRAHTREVFDRLMAGRARGVEHAENPVLTRDGRERIVAWHNSVLKDAEGVAAGTLSSGEDITERKAAERELKDIKYALDQASIVAITDQRGIIRYANDKFCEISGYSREELLGQDHRLLNSGRHPGAFFRDLWRTIAGGKVWRGEIRNRAKDGSYYWVDTTIVPFLDERGKPYQYLAIRSDITESKQAEKAFRERKALAQLGALAAVVAHEVKNPLAGIGGAIQIIGNRLPADSGDRDVIASILARIDALNRKIEDLLAYSRPRPPRFVAVPLHELITEITDLLRSDPGFADVEVRVRAERTVIHADPDQLREVFVNLLLNAAQAMKGKGRIGIRVAHDGKWCRISMTDNGPGIASDAKGRVFEPFFSTRHSGTGLGLSIAKRVIEDHGGKIRIDDIEDGGTKVSLRLPIERPEEPGGMLVLD